ncbi:YlmC/YmxH family sporulation protein [Anaerovoracaceae bacterium 41-7]|jgi:YlmC/YmxH family sporulation protein|uniref:YlmC/YmxH family sporulation protein n=1 Tax=Anaerotruncus colihominis TaxID=169435 RepID=A0A845QI55_9FIRM|nr:MULTISPECIES: YlmC/YmxH family sporulation protein [Clostridia]MCI9476676.1 YlmC/YmxH family sporulation protein [Emergencia sp.]MCI9638946.1 YlmC/YmxH family sporulation protein [Emergencia sp.]NBH60453.1 YlmC/YmxH family sporulation protein [Anaerotruncus colihominis]NCE97731.1 YlmC/YmxH family sporulation protein [Emergencia sp. 1XD21-10]NCF01107.1 YlmC/YmxH family sporulation protein [Anaerotruncus sp. 80]
MLLSEIGDKEVIDLSKGSRHGSFWDAEILFDEQTGKIRALLVPNFVSKSRFTAGHDTMQLPWESIVKIGEDMIIFRS